MKNLDITALENLDSDSKCNIALNIDSLDVLAFLAYDKDYMVRHEVTQNQNVSFEILKVLSDDIEVDVRIGVVMSPNVTRELFEKLSCDENYLVRLFVTMNPETPKDIFNRLLNDKELCDRNCFSGNKTPETISEHVYSKGNEALSKMIGE